MSAVGGAIELIKTGQDHTYSSILLSIWNCSSGSFLCFEVMEGHLHRILLDSDGSLPRVFLLFRPRNSSVLDQTILSQGHPEKSQIHSQSQRKVR